jgi:formylglycine-generating enzyme required for sulfatase activity
MSSSTFSYDNERPRHRVDVPAFRIARGPVMNATWLRFAEGGGYQRREWRSDEAWAWKEEYDITHHEAPGIARPHPGSRPTPSPVPTGCAFPRRQIASGLVLTDVRM